MDHTCHDFDSVYHYRVVVQGGGSLFDQDKMHLIVDAFGILLGAP